MYYIYNRKILALVFCLPVFVIRWKVISCKLVLHLVIKVLRWGGVYLPFAHKQGERTCLGCWMLTFLRQKVCRLDINNPDAIFILLLTHRCSWCIIIKWLYSITHPFKISKHCYAHEKNFLRLKSTKRQHKCVMQRMPKSPFVVGLRALTNAYYYMSNQGNNITELRLREK